MADPSNKRERSPAAPSIGDDTRPTKLSKFKSGDKASAVGVTNEKQPPEDVDPSEYPPTSTSPSTFPKASPATMKGRKVWTRVATHLKVADDDEEDEDGGQNAPGLASSSTVDSPVRFSFEVHVYKQKKRVDGKFRGYADKGRCTLEYREDGTIVCRQPGTLSAILIAKVPRVEFDPYG